MLEQKSTRNPEQMDIFLILERYNLESYQYLGIGSVITILVTVLSGLTCLYLSDVTDISEGLLFIFFLLSFITLFFIGSAIDENTRETRLRDVNERLQSNDI